MLIALLVFTFGNLALADNALVFQTDFGLKDRAVSAMNCVAYRVDNDLDIYNLYFKE